MRNFLDKYLHFIVWPVVIILATYGSWILINREENIISMPASDINQIGDEIPPAVVDQPILEEVTPDGAVRWTLYLDRIVREEGAIMELESPRALYRLEDGRVLEVTGDMGVYNEDERILELTGNVEGVARTDDFSFTVDQMIWNNPEGIITASGHVSVIRGGILLTGATLKIDLDSDYTSLEITGENDQGISIKSSGEALEELGLDL